MLLRGNTSKDSQYLRMMNGRIKAMPSHPKHKGIKMQAHHVISAEAVKLSSLGSKLEEFGYDINLAPNLAFLPCTLQGACHLGIQPHRGDHTALSGRDDTEESSYDDDDHPLSYHMLVMRKIQMLKLPISKACTGNDDPARSTVTEKMNTLSASILNLICLSPKLARLTSIADHFTIGSHVGCGGVDSIPDHKDAVNCPTGRSHYQQQGPSQRRENIRMNKLGTYTPKPGE